MPFTLRRNEFGGFNLVAECDICHLPVTRAVDARIYRLHHQEATPATGAASESQPRFTCSDACYNKLSAAAVPCTAMYFDHSLIDLMKQSGVDAIEMKRRDLREHEESAQGYIWDSPADVYFRQSRELDEWLERLQRLREDFERQFSREG